MTKPKHSKIGASSCARWFACPGSIEFCKDIPQEPSVYAKEGTQAHALGEYCLKNFVPPSKYINETVNLDGEKVLVDTEMAQAVQVYFDVVTEDLKDFYTNGIPMDQNEFFLEKRFHLTSVDEDAYGTSDAALAEVFSVLRVYDYKHGKGVPVDVKENKQLMYYALGVLQELDGTEDDFPWIELVIIQPRAPHPDGPVRKWRVSYGNLMMFKDELRMAIRATRLKDAPLRAGTHCRFCPGRKTGCPAITQEAVDVAQAQFAPAESNDGIGFAMKKPSEMTPTEIQKVLNAGVIINDWVESVQKFAHSRAETGEKIPGYKLVKKKSNRKWLDDDTVAGKFMEEYGTDIYTMKLKSPVQLGKIVPSKELEEFIIKPDTGTSLVLESDRRKEVAASVTTQFEVIE